MGLRGRDFGHVAGVDLITHAAVGAATGEWLLGKRLGNRALAWGCLFGLLPDVDALLMWVWNAANQLWWHRGPTHALLVIAAAVYGLSGWLARRWKRDKITRGRAAVFLAAALGGHVWLDCLTVYGTSVWWPLPLPRVALNQLFIIDPFFLMPLGVALVWLAFLRGKKQAAKRRRLLGWGTALAVGYVLLAVVMKRVADAGFAGDLARRGVSYERRSEAPTAFNILLWRAVVDRGDAYWVGYRTVFEPPGTPVRWTIYPKDAGALAGMEDLPEVRRVKWFTDGWWIARGHANGVWIGDLRFGEMRSWGDKKGMVDSWLPFAWNVTPDARGERLRALHPSRVQPGAMLTRMAARIAGDRKAWEANPRLAGLVGRLPEFLLVEE